ARNPGPNFWRLTACSSRTGKPKAQLAVSWFSSRPHLGFPCFGRNPASLPHRARSPTLATFRSIWPPIAPARPIFSNSSNILGRHEVPWRLGRDFPISPASPAASSQQPRRASSAA
ncbi:unnamed protein product, partial [Prunus brigantina]